MTTQLLQLTPNNAEMEQSLLASCLLFPDSVGDIIDDINETDFYRQAHKLIYRSIIELFEDGAPVDLMTVKESLQSKGLLEKVGGVTYLSLLADVPIPLSIPYACQSLKNTTAARELVAHGQMIVSACSEPHNIKDILDTAQNKLIAISDKMENNQAIMMQDLTSQSVNRYEAMQNDEPPKRLKTRFYEFNTLTGGGFWGKKFTVLAGRPRMGKTAIMLNMAQAIAEHGDMVGIFELEMDKEDLSDRLMSSSTGMSAMRLQSGEPLSRNEWKLIVDAADAARQLPIMVDDTGGLKIEELKRRARKMRKAGCEIIFIDQFSRIVGQRKRTLFEETTDVVKQISAMPKQLGIPVVLLAQINRKSTDRSNKRPTLEDLKMTGQLEEDPDLVLLLHRPSVYSKTDEDESVAYLEIAKQRGGPEQSIVLDFDGKTTTFSNPKQTDQRR